MQRLLFGFSFLTHPVFIPLFSIWVYYSLVLKYDQTPLVIGLCWLLFAYIFLPTFYFKKIKKIDLKAPSIPERRSIFKGYAVLNAVLGIVAYYIFKEYVAFFLGFAVMHLMLFLLTIIHLKASWHTGGWAYLLMSALVLWDKYRFVDFNIVVYTLLGIFILVFICRKLQNAHSWFELIMGVAVGITSSLVLIA